MPCFPLPILNHSLPINPTQVLTVCTCHINLYRWVWSVWIKKEVSKLRMQSGKIKIKFGKKIGTCSLLLAAWFCSSHKWLSVRLTVSLSILKLGQTTMSNYFVHIFTVFIFQYIKGYPDTFNTISDSIMTVSVINIPSIQSLFYIEDYWHSGPLPCLEISSWWKGPSPFLRCSLASLIHYLFH